MIFTYVGFSIFFQVSSMYIHVGVDVQQSTSNVYEGVYMFIASILTPPGIGNYAGIENTRAQRARRRRTAVPFLIKSRQAAEAARQAPLKAVGRGARLMASAPVRLFSKKVQTAVGFAENRCLRKIRCSFAWAMLEVLNRKTERDIAILKFSFFFQNIFLMIISRELLVVVPCYFRICVLVCMFIYIYFHV